VGNPPKFPQLLLQTLFQKRVSVTLSRCCEDGLFLHLGRRCPRAARRAVLGASRSGRLPPTPAVATGGICASLSSSGPTPPSTCRSPINGGDVVPGLCWCQALVLWRPAGDGGEGLHARLAACRWRARAALGRRWRAWGMRGQHILEVASGQCTWMCRRRLERTVAPGAVYEGRVCGTMRGSS
jgi:hypothetical protein